MKNGYNFGKEDLILFQPDSCFEKGMRLNMKINKKIIIYICIIILVILTIFIITKSVNDVQKNNQETIIEEISKVVDETPESLVGEGNKENPYLIQSIEDLVLISKGVNDGLIGKNKMYSLETDLDFKEKNSYVDADKINFAGLGDLNQNGIEEALYQELTTRNGFIPIGNNMDNAFSGEIRGNGHVISNLYSKNEKGYCGLIGIVSTNNENEIVKISNLTIKNAKIEGSNSGGLIGYCYQSSNITIDSCSIIDGNINGGSGAGGILGEAYSSNLKIANCKNTAKVSATIAGGIIGIAPTNIDIQDSFNEGEIKGDFFAGGIIGDGYSSNVIIKKCYNSGDISGNVASGIVCGKKVTIEDTLNLGKIDGNNIGAIISNSNIENLDVNIERCFYLKGSAGRGIKGIEDISGKVESLEEEEIKNKLTSW